jgi:hypothetical protein
MEPARHEFKVGKLVVNGERFDFKPEPALKFAAKPGDLGDIYLHYGYREASKAKETLNLSFTVELDGKVLGTRKTKVEDSRVVTDEQWGLLKHETTLNTKGTLKGRFTIEATYEKGAWSGKGGTAVTPFKQTGEFTVTVR